MSAIEYYELRRVRIEPPQPGEFRIASAATVICGLCSRYIDGSGGPGDGPICTPCGDALKRGALRGAVKWEDDAQ